MEHKSEELQQIRNETEVSLSGYYSLSNINHDAGRRYQKKRLKPAHRNGMWTWDIIPQSMNGVRKSRRSFERQNEKFDQILDL